MCAQCAAPKKWAPQISFWGKECAHIFVIGRPILILGQEMSAHFLNGAPHFNFGARNVRTFLKCVDINLYLI